MPTEPLPAGWEELTDDKGRKYYYCKSTKQTKWGRPKAKDAVTDGADAAAPAATKSPTPDVKATTETPPTEAGLPADWEEKKNGEGRVYYYNKKTKETSWKKPASAASTPAAATATPPQQTESGLADDWEEKKNGEGRVYYYNKKTKETSWKKPKGAATLDVKATETPPPTEAGLPADWEEKKNGEGRVYYYNKKTKETSWKKPASAASTPAAATATPPQQTESGLPDDWEEKKNGEGRVYYYNKKTKETSWKKPKGAGVPASASATPEAPPPASATSTPPQADDGPLPPDWSEKQDNKGKTYYYNKKTKETSWKKPAPIVSAVSTPDPGPTPLPPDWAEKKDSNGKTYYYNKMTKETSWKRPPPPPASRRGSTSAPLSAATLSAAGINLAQLPEDWEEKVDSNGRTFYINRKTLETTWHRPAPKLTKDQIGSLLMSNDTLPENILVQHPDWSKKFDAKTGLVYYYNGKTRDTRWLDTNTGETSRLLRMPDLKTSIFVFGGVVQVGGGGGKLEQLQQQVLCFNGSDWVPSAFPMPQALESPVAVPVIPTGNQDRCFVFGTRKDTRIPTCLEYVPDTGILGRPEFASAVVAGSASTGAPHAVVTTGGFSHLDKCSVTGESFLLDTTRHSKHNLPSLNVPRASHTLSLINLSTPGRVLWFCYAVGGYDGRKKISGVERYVLGEDKWETMSSMRRSRSGHGAVTVERAVYVFGGREGYTTVNTGEYMHSQTDIWTETSNMRTARSNFGIELVNSHYIFVAGGWSGKEWLASVEVYDVRMDMWRDVVALPHLISSPGTAVMKIPSDLTAAALSGGGNEKAATTASDEAKAKAEEEARQRAAATNLQVKGGKSIDAKTLGYDF